MKRTQAVAGLLCAVAAAAVLAAPSLKAGSEPISYVDTNKIKAEGLQRSQVMDLASWLTDVYAPRLTGSPMSQKAAEWTVAKDQNVRLRSGSVGAPSFLGVVILGAALALLLLGQLTSIFLFQHLGLVTAIAGLVAAFGGKSLLRTTAAPVAFLFFAVPPPYWVITVLSWKFQQMSSVLRVLMVELMGIPVHLSGNIIDLGEYKLQVAEACSGLRYLFPFLSLGVMAAYMYRGRLWARADRRRHRADHHRDEFVPHRCDGRHGAGLWRRTRRRRAPLF